MYTIRVALVATMLIMMCHWAQAFPLNLKRQSSVWDPQTTYVVIVGVLNWRDRRYHGYPVRHRKDEELYHVLLDRGVPAANTQLLLDKDATHANIQRAVSSVADKAPKEATFIFYYAGQGYRSKDDRAYFETYDANYDDPEKTGFDVMEISQLLSAHFKGNQVLLMGDTSYSGALRDAAEALGKEGNAAVSLTSADEMGTSSHNWTFTQAIIESMRGNRLADHDRDGHVTLREMVEEVDGALLYRDDQKAGESNMGWFQGMVMADVQGKAVDPLERAQYKAGQYVQLLDDAGGNIARIVCVHGHAYRLQLYENANTSFMSAFESDFHLPNYTHYPLGSMLTVTRNNNRYMARVQRVDGDFMFVTYPDQPTLQGEWITSRRVVDAHNGSNHYSRAQ